MGKAALPRCTRHVLHLTVTKPNDQQPIKGSRDEKVLFQVYRFYEGRKHRFEALAAVVTRRLLAESNQRFTEGWITPPSADGGADFIGRLDIGSGFSTVKQVVYGQAKCQSPNTPVSGKDIARTVARLRRGWLAAFVTTSYFSETVQREIIDDEYPILLVHGKRLAEEIQLMMFEEGFKNVDTLLRAIDREYEARIAHRRPEEILHL